MFFCRNFHPIKQNSQNNVLTLSAWSTKLHMGHDELERITFPLQIKQTDHLPFKICDINSRTKLTFHFLRLLSAFYL